MFAKTFPDQNTDIRVNDLARAYVEEKIRSTVKDPGTAVDLVPVDHPIGAKRICSDLGYYEVFNNDHVRLVNLRREPIKEVSTRAIVTADREIELDLLIFATGFDAMTGALTRIELTGPRGDTITNLWRHGPFTYLGVAVPGMPNLFVLNGAGTPSVLANMALTAEQQVNWTIDLIAYCVARGIDEVEPRADAARKWTDHVALVGEKTFMAQVKLVVRGRQHRRQAASISALRGRIRHIHTDLRSGRGTRLRRLCAYAPQQNCLVQLRRHLA